jgi:hypothetical protein
LDPPTIARASTIISEKASIIITEEIMDMEMTAATTTVSDGSDEH